MSIHEESDDTLEKFKEAIEFSKEKMRKHLMDMTKEDRFNVLRENYSFKSCEEISKWALPEEDYEICASVKDVLANNIDIFKISFSFEGKLNNTALIVKFKRKDDRIYYHADYILNNGEEGTVVMLYKDEQDIWNSEWVSSNPIMFKPIGEAIELFEDCL